MYIFFCATMKKERIMFILYIYFFYWNSFTILTVFCYSWLANFRNHRVTFFPHNNNLRRSFFQFFFFFLLFCWQGLTFCFIHSRIRYPCVYFMSLIKSFVSEKYSRFEVYILCIECLTIIFYFFKFSYHDQSIVSLII